MADRVKRRRVYREPRCTKAQWCDSEWYVQAVVIRLKRRVGTRKQQGTH